MRKEVVSFTHLNQKKLYFNENRNILWRKVIGSYCCHWFEHYLTQLNIHNSWFCSRLEGYLIFFIKSGYLEKKKSSMGLLILWRCWYNGSSGVFGAFFSLSLVLYLLFNMTFKYCQILRDLATIPEHLESFLNQS